MRPNLVFIRSGSRSLHRRLIQEDPRRNWDCCVSWYSGRGADDSGAEFFADGGSNKFQGFEAFAERAADSLAAYRAVILLDDDLLFDPGAISRFFDIFAAHGLDLAQPALTWSCYWNYLALVHNPTTIARHVSFIEVMAPCFSARALQALRPTFRLTESTWGIDWAWVADGRYARYVVDAVKMAHVKPMDSTGGAFYRSLTARGVCAKTELQAVLAGLGYDPARIAAMRAAGAMPCTVPYDVPSTTA